MDRLVKELAYSLIEDKSIFQANLIIYILNMGYIEGFLDSYYLYKLQDEIHKFPDNYIFRYRNWACSIVDQIISKTVDQSWMNW